VRARHTLVYEVKKDDVVGYFHLSLQFGPGHIFLFCNFDGLRLTLFYTFFSRNETFSVLRPLFKKAGEA
jgi:hypothetical protein